MEGQRRGLLNTAASSSSGFALPPCTGPEVGVLGACVTSYFLPTSDPMVDEGSHAYGCLETEEAENCLSL